MWQKRFKGLQLQAGSPPRRASINGPIDRARFMTPQDTAVNAAGDIFVVDGGSNAIRKISNGVVSTFAGKVGHAGSADGVGGEARFKYPTGIEIDASENLYVVDQDNNTIRKITPAGVVTTIAGTAGEVGDTNGAGAAARFRAPTDIAIAPNGDFYISDTGNSQIRKMTSAGVVTTLAGESGSSSCADGTGTLASLAWVSGIAVNSDGDIYVTNAACNVIRKVTPAGVVTTLAGQSYVSDFIDGTGSAARFSWPFGVTLDSAGNLYVSDFDNSAIRKITPAGVVTTFAGGTYGSQDGTGTAAHFNGPARMGKDAAGNLYLAEREAATVRKITPSAVVTLVAGTFSEDNNGSTDAMGMAGKFNVPQSVASDSVGNLYVADSDNYTIRKVTPAGVVTTLAGSPGLGGSTNGTGSAARFMAPTGITMGSDGNLYVADRTRIRKVTQAGVVTTLAGASGSGSVDGSGAAARFGEAKDIAADGLGGLYVLDYLNKTVRKINFSGDVITLAGTAGETGYVDGTGPAARFGTMNAIAVTPSGDIFVTDTDNNCIRKITSAGVVSTYSGLAGDSAIVDGIAGVARFKQPKGITSDVAGNLFVSDFADPVIRKVTPAGVVTTIAGMLSDDMAYTNGITTGNSPDHVGDIADICVFGRRIYFVGDHMVKWIPRP